MKVEEFSEAFYRSLLEYLESKYIGFRFSEITYDTHTDEPIGSYEWWIEDKYTGDEGFSSCKEIVENVFNNLRYFV